MKRAIVMRIAIATGLFAAIIACLTSLPLPSAHQVVASMDSELGGVGAYLPGPAPHPRLPIASAWIGVDFGCRFPLRDAVRRRDGIAWGHTGRYGSLCRGPLSGPRVRRRRDSRSSSLSCHSTAKNLANLATGKVEGRIETQVLLGAWWP